MQQENGYRDLIRIISLLETVECRRCKRKAFSWCDCNEITFIGEGGGGRGGGGGGGDGG